MEEPDLSFLTGLAGCSTECSLSEFKDHLKADLSEKMQNSEWWVFWTEESPKQTEYVLHHPSSSISYEKEIRDKIKTVLEDMASTTWVPRCLLQFWAPKKYGQHHYLTTLEQPFGVGYLCKGDCWYRKLCMDNCYYVEEGAKEEQLGAVGRVYRNKRLESTPDLRLYSTNEFPLRDSAARFGFRDYLALPLFDSSGSECYGVLEVLTSRKVWAEDVFFDLDLALQKANLRSTHTYFVDFDEVSPQVEVERELSKMLELAIKAVPQLHLAQVWVPCKQCTSASNSLICLKRSTFICTANQIVNSLDDIDTYMLEYLDASDFHNLQIQKGITSYLCRNLCDSICENPLAHYAQKARLSLSFLVSLENLHNSNDIYVIEFFFHSKSIEEACGGSSLNLLFQIMRMELSGFKLASGGQLLEELVVQPSQSDAIPYKTTIMLTAMKRYRGMSSESDFLKYLPTASFFCLQPPNKDGWDFRCPARYLSENAFNNNSSLVNNSIKERIKVFFNEIAETVNSYSLVQFWARKMEEKRCCLATSDQPYALGCLDEGLASFRKQCMKHQYFVDEGATEEQLGPLGRVFRNGYPEMTPDLCFYSTREFALRNHAKNARLQEYYALPVFDSHEHQCMGVLELFGFKDSTLKFIKKALQVADLSSIHNDFGPSFLPHYPTANITECQEQAFTEVRAALHLVSQIPQLFMAEIWVPCSSCASTNRNLNCLELAEKTGCYSEPKIYSSIGKGVAGMVLASEEKSCLFRNVCDFSITEEPTAHYQQQKRLDACFAICLQSSHTGDFPYVLKFFLNKGPAIYEHLWSFFKFLLPVMRQELKTFKVASGKQIGEELVVEAIGFSEADKLTFSVVTSQIKFKFVQYGKMEHQNSNNQQVHCVSYSSDSVRELADAEECTAVVANSKKVDAAKKTERGKRKTGLRLNLEDLKPHFGKKLEDVKEELGVGRSTIKRVLREHDIPRWPNNKKYKKNPSLFMKECATENIAQQKQRPSSSSDVRPSNMPLQQNVPQTRTGITQQLAVEVEDEDVMVKVKYNQDEFIKFRFYLSSGMDKLLEEVTKRIKLDKGSYKLKYADEDNDEISLACDDDLKLCPKNVTKSGKDCIQLFVSTLKR